MPELSYINREFDEEHAFLQSFDLYMKQLGPAGPSRLVQLYAAATAVLFLRLTHPAARPANLPGLRVALNWSLRLPRTLQVTAEADPWPGSEGAPSRLDVGIYKEDPSVLGRPEGECPSVVAALDYNQEEPREWVRSSSGILLFPAEVRSHLRVRPEGVSPQQCLDLETRCAGFPVSRGEYGSSVIGAALIVGEYHGASG